MPRNNIHGQERPFRNRAMNLRTNGWFFAGVAGVIAVVALATILTVYPAGTTITGGQRSVSATSSDGLQLTLQISGSVVQQGSSVAINVTEANINAKPLNVSASTAWPVQGLRMSACYSSIYPFGVAVYEGHYTQANLSSAARLNLYPLVPCPLFIRYISGYYFQPNSNEAVVLPGSGSATPMASGVVASGNYTQGESRTNFAPGEYTVAAGDEWGSLVFLYFVVR